MPTRPLDKSGRSRHSQWIRARLKSPGGSSEARRAPAGAARVARRRERSRALERAQSAGRFDGANTHSCHRGRRVHRPPSVTYLEGARLLGARRRRQSSRSTARPRPTSSRSRPARAGTTACEATRGVDEVYALAADMGGMGFISANHAQILHNNALINLHTIEAARQQRRAALPVHFLRLHLSRVSQTEADVTPLKEEDAYAGRAAGRLRLGEARSPSGSAGTTATIRPRDPQSCASTTSTARWGPGTADGKRLPPPCAARSPWPSLPATASRDLGRRRADALVLLHRRLRRRHSKS